MPKINRTQLKGRFDGFLKLVRENCGALFQRSKRLTGKLHHRKAAVSSPSQSPEKKPKRRFNLSKFDLKRISEHPTLIRWCLIVLALYFASDIVSKIIGLAIRPKFVPLPKPVTQSIPLTAPLEDIDIVTRRNVFDVNRVVPPVFEEAQLDCFVQAKPSTQRIVLLGTIVMNDDTHSVALLQDADNTTKIGVKKEEYFFDRKFVALKVERKKLCFQNVATQEYEFVEIPEEQIALGISGPSLLTSTGGGISALSDKNFSVAKNFLDEKMLNLNEILQTARAVPYIEPGTGKFRGFLVQTIEANSPFAQLGIRQGDILTDVNDIVLDNAGKGLEAFQRLKNSNRVEIVVLRGGEKTTLTYEVK